MGFVAGLWLWHASSLPTTIFAILAALTGPYLLLFLWLGRGKASVGARCRIAAKLTQKPSHRRLGAGSEASPPLPAVVARTVRPRPRVWTRQTPYNRRLGRRLRGPFQRRRDAPACVQSAKPARQASFLVILGHAKGGCTGRAVPFKYSTRLPPHANFRPHRLGSEPTHTTRRSPAQTARANRRHRSDGRRRRHGHAVASTNRVGIAYSYRN